MQIEFLLEQLSIEKNNQLVASPWILRDSNTASQADERLCSKKKENDIVTKINFLKYL
jgi:hypothetical protein